MGLKAVSTVSEDDSPNKPSQSEQVEPSEQELLEYLQGESGLSDTEIEDAAEAWIENASFLTQKMAYWLVAKDNGLEPSEYFDTRTEFHDFCIADIVPQINVSLRAEIVRTEIKDPDNEDWTLQKLLLRDESDSIWIALWNEDVDRSLTEGQTIELHNCWSKEYRGEPQIALGKGGEITPV